MKPKLSIIIATLGFSSLYNTIDSVIKNKGQTKIEIIVIGKLKDNKINGYKKFKFIRHFPVQFESGDLSRKRNLGIEKSNADIVAFIDDDVVVTKNWIDNGLRKFKDKNVGIVSGPGLVPKKAGFLTRLFGNTLSSLGAFPIRNRYRKGKKIEKDCCGDKIIGCNMFIRKKAYQKIGGFNPEIIPAEEIDFASRAIKNGFKVYMNPKVSVFHFARSNFRTFFKQIFRFGKSKIISIKIGSQPAKFIYFLPALAVLLPPIFVLSSFLSYLVLDAALLLLVIYFLFVIIASVCSIAETKNPGSILLILTIPIMHFAYGLGEVYELFWGYKK